MELHELGDHIQNLCHEGHSLARVKFGIDDIEYKLKSIDVTPTSVTFQLQAVTQEAQHEGFLSR